MLQTKNVFIKDLTDVFQKKQERFILYAYSYVRDRHEAEDIVMNAFTTIWEKREQLQTHTNINALLLTAIKNRCLNHLEHLQVKMRAEQKISNIKQKEINLRIASLEACNPDKIFCSEIQELLNKTISNLPDTSKRVFLLSRRNDLTNKEIAQELNISIKTVEFHMTKSLKILKEKLRDYSLAVFFF